LSEIVYNKPETAALPMDELGSNLAGETTEMVSEAGVNTTSELRKRRSTRIVQAVPLQVTGVDALGRPFMERTSSLILNCHGCRYQSKHYVLKNMWVKLEIPHPETDQPPRTVRGRVAWIQRPRTVRQLFQVALELETPGNVWGIGFPPEDWFGFSDPGKQLQSSAAAPALAQGSFSGAAPAQQASTAQAQQSAPSETEFHVSLTEPDPSATGSPDNVRVFPSPASTTDASLQLARHVTRLLAEARQQIQAAARDAAAHAVSAEFHVSAEQWEHKLTEGREELSRALASAIEKIQEETNARTRAAHEATASALHEELPQRIAPQLEQLTRDLTARLSEEALAQRTAHEQHLTAVAESLRNSSQQAEETAARLRSHAEESEARIAARAEAANRAMEAAAAEREQTASAQRESIAAAANEAQQQVASSFESARGNWQAHLASETEVAQSRWQSAIDSAFAGAQERASYLLNERAQELTSEFQRESARLSDAFHASAADATNRSEQRVAGLHESVQAHTERVEGALSRAAEASERLENLSARLETGQQQALSGFQSQVDDVLSLHRNELHRRSESIFEEIAARIRGAFEESSQQAVAQFGQQITAMVQPQIASTDEAMQRLAGGRSLLDAAVTMHQERIRATTDGAFAEALAKFQGNLSTVEDALRGSAEAVTARSLSDLEIRVESVKHQTVEDLIKSAEWYEKRAQTQMQSLADKVGEQSIVQLREKANEVLSEFSSEIDQSSRNFITYAQTQMADVVSESFDRARALFAEAAETTSAAFVDEIQRHARQDLDGFAEELQKSSTEAQTRLDAARAEHTEKVTSEQEDFLRRFQTSMSGAMEAGVAEANEKVQAGFEPLLKSWRSMTEAHQTEMYEIYTKLGEQAANQYCERLDNVSNQWMLATVTSLDHQSRDAVAKIAVTAEEKLRETCTKVFADIGDSLRDRLQQIASNLNPPAKGATP
jgi:hypothetical protein